MTLLYITLHYCTLLYITVHYISYIDLVSSWHQPNSLTSSHQVWMALQSTATSRKGGAEWPWPRFRLGLKKWAKETRLDKHIKHKPNCCFMRWIEADFLIGPGGSPNPQECCHQHPEVGRESVVTKPEQCICWPMLTRCSRRLISFDASLNHCIYFLIIIIAGRTFAFVWIAQPFMKNLGYLGIEILGMGQNFTRASVSSSMMSPWKAWWLFRPGSVLECRVLLFVLILWAAGIWTRTIHCFTSWGFSSVHFHSVTI